YTIDLVPLPLLLYSPSSSFSCHAPHPHLHSFPTRRSSDLTTQYRSDFSRNTLSCSSVASGASILKWRRILSKPTGTSFEIPRVRSEEHTSELQSRSDLVCRLLLEKKNLITTSATHRAVVSA